MALGQKTTRPRKAPLRNSTTAELSAALVQAERTIEKLRARVDEREQSRQTLEELTLDLAERVKELNCLYSISSIFEQQDSSLDEILQRTAELIPAAWQYPKSRATVSRCTIGHARPPASVRHPGANRSPSSSTTAGSARSTFITPRRGRNETRGSLPQGRKKPPQRRCRQNRRNHRAQAG